MLKTQCNTIWESEPMKIGKHEWRVSVYRSKFYGPCTIYEWRNLRNVQSGLDHWCEDKLWPSYNSDDTYSGIPKTLAQLYEKNRGEIKSALSGKPITYELTPEGEQAVIPGCERVPTDKKPQMELF